MHGPAQRRDRRGVTAGVHGVGQQDHPHAAHRIQGQARAGEAGVRHGGRRPAAAQDVEGVAGAGPAVAAAAAEALGLAAGRGPAQGGRDHGVVGTDPPGGEPGQVRRRGEQPGVTGHPAHQARVLVVHRAGPGGAVGAAFGGGEALCRAVRPESGRGQPERPGHQPTDGRVERLARHRRHHLAEEHESRVGVAGPGSGRDVQRGLAQVAEKFGARSAPAVELAAARQA